MGLCLVFSDSTTTLCLHPHSLKGGGEGGGGGGGGGEGVQLMVHVVRVECHWASQRT